MYKEGRLLLDEHGDAIRGGREARALQNKTRFGKHLGFMNWIGYEFQVQTILYQAAEAHDEPDGAAHLRPSTRPSSLLRLEATECPKTAANNCVGLHVCIVGEMYSR